MLMVRSICLVKEYATERVLANSSGSEVVMVCSFLSNPLIPTLIWVQRSTNSIVSSEELMYP